MWEWLNISGVREGLKTFSDAEAKAAAKAAQQAEKIAEAAAKARAAQLTQMVAQNPGRAKAIVGAVDGIAAAGRGAKNLVGKAKTAGKWGVGIAAGAGLLAYIASRTNKGPVDAIREGNDMGARMAPEMNDIPVMPAFGPADGRAPDHWRNVVGAQRGGQEMGMNPSLDADLAANAQDAAAAAAQAPAR